MEIIDIHKFRENAISDNLCSEYEEKWGTGLSKKMLIDLALEVKGADYICDSISKGWGISPEYISSNFKKFINGSYVAEIDGYDSKMYCEYSGAVIPDTTILILINSNVTLTATKNNVSQIFCTGKCNILLEGEGDCIFVCYGDHSNILINNESSGKTKRIQKENKDKY